MYIATYARIVDGQKQVCYDTLNLFSSIIKGMTKKTQESRQLSH